MRDGLTLIHGYSDRLITLSNDLPVRFKINVISEFYLFSCEKTILKRKNVYTCRCEVIKGL